MMKKIMLLLLKDNTLAIYAQILVKTFPFLPTGSSVSAQSEDWGPWIHGTVVRHGSDDHHGRSYRTE